MVDRKYAFPNWATGPGWGYEECNRSTHDSACPSNCAGDSLRLQSETIEWRSGRARLSKLARDEPPLVLSVFMMNHEPLLDWGAGNPCTGKDAANDRPRSDAHLRAFFCALVGNGLRGIFQLTGRWRDGIEGGQRWTGGGKDNVAILILSFSLSFLCLFNGHVKEQTCFHISQINPIT